MKKSLLLVFLVLSTGMTAEARKPRVPQAATQPSVQAQATRADQVTTAICSLDEYMKIYPSKTGMLDAIDELNATGTRDDFPQDGSPSHASSRYGNRVRFCQKYYPVKAFIRSDDANQDFLTNNALYDICMGSGLGGESDRHFMSGLSTDEEETIAAATLRIIENSKNNFRNDRLSRELECPTRLSEQAASPADLDFTRKAVAYKASVESVEKVTPRTECSPMTAGTLIVTNPAEAVVKKLTETISRDDQVKTAVCSLNEYMKTHLSKTAKLNAYDEYQARDVDDQRFANRSRFCNSYYPTINGKSHIRSDEADRENLGNVVLYSVCMGDAKGITGLVNDELDLIDSYTNQININAKNVRNGIKAKDPIEAELNCSGRLGVQLSANADRSLK